MAKLKKNEQIMLVLILVVVAAFVILDPYHIFRSPPAEVSKKDSSKQQVKVTPDIKTVGGVDFSGESERIELAGWERDPFVRTRPDLEEDAFISSLRLTAISVRGSDRMAMINSKPVRVGDSIHGLQVSKIESGKVTLQSGENSYTLTWEK